ncbi:MAG: hypothetical protein ACXV3F_13925 [Frankiaceae bacterium]
MPIPSVTADRGRLVWWGGLAGAAALGVLDWPVAAAVAAGTYIAERRARAGREPAESGGLQDDD